MEVQFVKMYHKVQSKWDLITDILKDGGRPLTKKLKYISKMYFHGIFKGD